MTQNKVMLNSDEGPSAESYHKIPKQITHYALLGIYPSASAIEIRRAYWELSKRYHPDTTELPSAVATAKFQQLNQAYATLSNPERRLTYDLKIGYSRISVIQAPPDLNHPARSVQAWQSKSAYLDPSDRPLSAGEISALFILCLTLLGCLLLAIAIGLTRDNTAFQPIVLQPLKPVKEQFRSYMPTMTQLFALEKPVFLDFNFLPETQNSK